MFVYWQSIKVTINSPYSLESDLSFSTGLSTMGGISRLNGGFGLVIN